MNIKEFAHKQEVVKDTIDDPEIVEKYGEPITFYTHNVVKLTTYFDFFNARSNNQYSQLDLMMKNMILDENGLKVLEPDEDLPIDIAAAAINKIGEILGKPQSKASIQTTGDQPK